MRILTVVGARPQFIKAAVVSYAIRNVTGLQEALLHTGQHFDANMSQVFFDELGIPAPEFNLDIHGGSHGEMTGRMLEGIERVLLDNQPDVVLVYGDTNSTLAGALAAVKQHIPVAHVEAGLRSFNRRMPEEINRVLTDNASDLLLAPTDGAVGNLADEGIVGEKVQLVGDVMYDVTLRFSEMAIRRSEILKRLELMDDAYVVCTIHRAENTDDVTRLRNIFNALDVLARDIRIVLPLHPRTMSVLARAGIDLAASPNMIVIEPVGYLDMIRLESAAELIVTDSGGVQKEAFFHRVPCVTLRSETEWTELVDSGWNSLASPESPELILNAMRNAVGAVRTEISCYGNGDAAQRVVEALVNAYN